MQFFVAIIICAILSGTTITRCSPQAHNLCSSKKSETTCFCQHRTDTSTNFPTFTADCSRLNLKEFPRDTQVQNVEELDLSHNTITILDSFRNSFESTSVRSIKLSFNKLLHISQDFFLNTPNLAELDLSNNVLANFPNSNAFRGLQNLTVLNLSFNGLSTLPEGLFANMPNLKELDLRYNYLGALLMDSEHMFSSRLGLSPGMKVLKLDGLGISNLHYAYFDAADNLKHLSLSDNPLQEIPSVPYTLDSLDLSGTDITTLSAKRLNYHSLKVLKLNRLRKLEKIEHYAFYNLQALEELHLSDSRNLKEFNDLAFGIILNDVQLSLKRISLARSGLKSLNVSFLSLFKKMEHVDLQSNPWACNCDLLWLHELNGSLFGGDNLRCFSPTSLVNRKVMELTVESVPSCPKSDKSFQRILISILGSLVAILMILIVYLLYLGPFTKSNKYRGIGPESPYHGNTIGIIPTRAEIL